MLQKRAEAVNSIKANLNAVFDIPHKQSRKSNITEEK